MNLRIQVRIIPNARKDEVIGFLDEAIKIKIKAKPTEGKANDHLIKFLSEKLFIHQNEIRIISGATSRLKVLEINNMNSHDLLLRLGLD